MDWQYLDSLAAHRAVVADVQRLAVDATSLYWTDATVGTVMKLTPK